MSRDNLGSNLVFFLVGAAIGVSVALLYAPQDGETTRRMIGEKAGDLKDKATEFSTNAAASAREKWGVASGKISSLVQRGQNTAGAIADAADETGRAAINSVN